MPVNNSRSARAYRRGEALKRRLNDFRKWGEMKDPIIKGGKFCDPEKKTKIASQDITNIKAKMTPSVVRETGEELMAVDVFTAKNAAEVTEAMMEEMDFT